MCLYDKDPPESPALTRQDQGLSPASPQQMPCEKMLAWQCPEASAIRQGRLISQSDIQGGNADKPKKQQVPGPQWGWNHRNAEGSRWGQRKGKQVFSKEPFPCRPLRPLFQRLFLSNINEALPSARHCAHAFSDAHTFETEEGWVLVMDSRCQKSQALQGVHTTPSSWSCGGREHHQISKQAWVYYGI